MFSFLKDKLKSAIGKFTKDVAADAETTEVKKEEVIQQSQEIKKEEEKKEINEQIKEEIEEKKIHHEIHKKETQNIETENKHETKSDSAQTDHQKKHPEKQSKENIKEKKKTDSEKHTEYIDLQKNEEILDQDLKEELAEKKGFFSKMKEKFTKKKDKELQKEKIKTATEEIKNEIKVIQELEKKELEKEKIEEEFNEEIIKYGAEKKSQKEKELQQFNKKEEKEYRELKEESLPLEPAQIIPEKETITAPIVQQIKETRKQPIENEQPKKGFFSKLTDTITKTNLSEEKFNDIFWELEIILMENNVAVEVIDKIKSDLKKELVDSKVKRGTVEEIISETLRNTIDELFTVQKMDFLEKVKSKKPCIIAFFGINGSGKTTTIAKIANLLQKNNLTCVIAAGDTFRAAAIQQIEEHSTKLNIKLIKHEYGSDPAAVAFDAIKYAEAKKIDVVLIDTAGRMQSNANLMDEMKKIIRVANPDLKIFIGEAITGNDCVDQAKEFNTAIGIDGIILCKADVDEKGGAALSISYVIQKPILFLGVGQTYDDLQEFDKETIMESLGV